MKKRTKILSLLSSVALSASLFVNCPITHGYFEEALEFLKSSGRLTLEQSESLKSILKTDLNNILLEIKQKDEDIKRHNLPDTNPMVQGVKLVNNFCKAVQDYLDPEKITAVLKTDCLKNGLKAMKGFRMKLPEGLNERVFMDLVEPKVIYFLDLYDILQNPTVKVKLKKEKDLNILRKEIKATIAKNHAIMTSLKLQVKNKNEYNTEHEFENDWKVFAWGPDLTMKNLAEAICNWNEENPDSIKQWWTSRFQSTRNEIKRMAYDETNGQWEPEDKQVIDEFFMCLDSYVK